MKPIAEGFMHSDVTEIVELLRERPSLSRAELGQNLGRTPATVTHLVRGLINSGIVVEIDSHRSINGRPRIPLHLNPSVMYAFAVDVGIESVSIAVLDFSGKMIYLHEIPQSVSAITEGISVIADGIQYVFAQVGIDKEKFCGLGVSIPGIFNTAKGTVIFSPNLPEWTGMSLQEMFRTETGLDTVIVENDANAAALGELWFGAGKKLQDFICVISEVGIGAGLIHNRQLVRGEDGAAGEIGHMLVDTDTEAPLCGCGKQGCLESFASLSVVKKRIEQGESIAEVLDQTTNYLGIAYSNLVNTFSPQALILLGSMMTDYPEMWPLAIQKTRARMMPYLLNRTLFLPSALGKHAPLYGLAGLLFAEALKNGWPRKLVRSSP